MFKYKGLEGNDAWKLYMSEGKKGTPTPGDQTFGSLLDEAQQQASGPPLPEEPLAPEVPLPPPEAPRPPQPAEQPDAMGAAAAAAPLLGPVGTAAAVATAAYQIGGDLKAATETKGSIGQYLIGGGGTGQNENAIPQAMLGALNRIAGLRSRM